MGLYFLRCVGALADGIEGGVDAIMFGNENDRPYQLHAPAEGVAAMAAVVSSVKPLLKVPFGVNYLWDLVAAAATGGQSVSCQEGHEKK